MGVPWTGPQCLDPQALQNRACPCFRTPNAERHWVPPVPPVPPVASLNVFPASRKNGPKIEGHRHKWSPNHLCGFHIAHEVFVRRRRPNHQKGLPIARSGTKSAVDLMPPGHCRALPLPSTRTVVLRFSLPSFLHRLRLSLGWLRSRRACLRFAGSPGTVTVLSRSAYASENSLLRHFAVWAPETLSSDRKPLRS